MLGNIFSILIILLIPKIIFAEDIYKEFITIPFPIAKLISIYQNENIPQDCKSIEPYLKDKSSWKINSENYFKPNPDKKTHWIRFTIVNNENEDELLVLSFFNSYFSKILLCEKVDDDWKVSRAGLDIPIDRWPFYERYPLLSFIVPHNTKRDYLIKFESNRIINQNLTLYNLKDFLVKIRTYNLITYSLIFSCILFIIYNTYLLISKNKIIYFYFILYIMTISVITFLKFGFFNSYQYLFNIITSNLVFIPFIFSVATALLLASKFFKIKNSSPTKIPIILTTLSIITIGISILGFLNYSEIFKVRFLSIYSLLIIGLIIIFSLKYLKEGNLFAEYFFYSWVCLFFTGIVQALFQLQHLPNGIASSLFFFFIPLHFMLINYSIHLKLKKEYEQDVSEKVKLEKSNESPLKSVYKKSYIEGVNIGNISKKLEKLLNEDKIFLDEELKSGDLATMLLLTQHQLSQFLSQIMNTNYSKLIQEYRVKEAMKLIIENPNKNILDIGYEVGFQSKSAFNLAFKKFTNMTPIEFKNRENKIYETKN